MAFTTFGQETAGTILTALEATWDTHSGLHPYRHLRTQPTSVRYTVLSLKTPSTQY